MLLHVGREFPVRGQHLRPHNAPRNQAAQIQVESSEMVTQRVFFAMQELGQRGDDFVKAAVADAALALRCFGNAVSFVHESVFGVHGEYQPAVKLAAFCRAGGGNQVFLRE